MECHRDLEGIVSMLSATAPLAPSSIVVAHGGVFTGHWEFDLAIACAFFAVVSYSFLLPADAPRRMGRAVIYGVAALCLIVALVLAAMGLRSMALGQ